MEKIINNEIFTPLLDYKANPAVSIYIPMARASEETLKNPIRFKNARKRLESELKEHGYDDRVIRSLTDQLADAGDEFEFFQNQLGGLAIFLAEDFLKMVKVPHKFEDWVQVGETFELRPLLQAYQNGIEFYIIALSRENARLFKTSKFDIAEVELGGDVPTNFEEAMKYDDFQDHLQHQTISGADGGNSPVFHGHTESDDEKKNLRRFFSMLDQGIANAAAQHNLPFLLVGLDYLQPIYRDTSGLANLLDTGLIKNPDKMSLDELHQQAWEVVREAVQTDVQEAVTRYQQVIGSEKGTADLSEIPLAAAYGKVGTLLVNKQAQIWGHINPEQDELEIDENGDIDLLDFSVKQTLLNGGDVYVFDKNEMPSEESDALVVLRY